MDLPLSNDLEVITWQLGRAPQGVVAVARRCPYGYPQVTVNHPLRREGEKFAIFPTLFWLTCPFLVAKVARLETGGGVGRYERLLGADPKLAREYVQAHEAYCRERIALLSQEERGFLRERAAWEAVTTGIGGLRNPRRVKCLHAQLAHFLARGENPIGEQVAAELRELYCPPKRVLCAAAQESLTPKSLW